MAIGNPGFVVGVRKDEAARNPIKTFVSRYFYLCMGLAMAGLVVWGFSRTVDHNLFHASPPRPSLLWMHGAAFSTWVVFFILQATLVRTRNMRLHRTLGWFGAGLATAMVTLGFTIAVVMARFDTFVLHQQGVDAFLSIPFTDMIAFGTCVALAIYWRRKPEYHRRLLFIASCQLMDAAVGRFDYIFNNNLFFPVLDLLIVLGMLRDWWVDGRVHKIYLYALPPLIVTQAFAVYLWRLDPGWWQKITHAILVG